MKNSSAKPVNIEFRLLTALGIIFVICGHYGIGSLTLDWLYPYDCFHIPMFMFISGYFFSQKAIESIESVANYVKKKVFHLLIPYFAWNTIYGVVGRILVHRGYTLALSVPFSPYTFFVRPFLLSDGFGYNVAAWFLMSLFIVELANCFIRYIINKLSITSDWVWMLLYFAIAFGGILLGQSYHDVLWDTGIPRNMYLLFWYGLGTYYKTTLEKWDRRIPFHVVLSINLFSSAFLAYTQNNAIPVVYASSFPGPPLYFFIRAFLGIWFWLRIVRFLLPVLSQCKLLLFIGEHSFSYMMHQCIVCSALNYLFWKLGYPFFDVATFKSVSWFSIDIGPSKIVYLLWVLGIITPLLQLYDTKISPKLTQIKRLVSKTSSV